MPPQIQKLVTLAIIVLVPVAILLGMIIGRFRSPSLTAPFAQQTQTPTEPTSIPQISADTSATVAPAVATETIPQTILQRVRKNGYLMCGVDKNLRGFSEPVDKEGNPDPERNLDFVTFEKDYGDFKGFEADFCKIIATAIFSDTTDSLNNRIRFIPVVLLPDEGGAPENERFRVVTDGTVDVVIRSTTWTATRDSNLKAEDSGYERGRVDFGPVIYHDAQRFLIKWLTVIGRAPTLEDLNGKRLCVGQGTTHIDNLAALPDTVKITEDRVSDGDLRSRFLQSCDAVTADTSRLLSEFGDLLTQPDYALIGQEISREPLAPMFRENDSQWRDIVNYAIYATFYANELDVTQAKVPDLKGESRDIRIRRLLGDQGSLGEDLGLDNDFAYRIIKNFGNYQEIYDRHLAVPFNLDTRSPEEAEQIRGPNRAWNYGGDLVSPPF